MHSRRLKEKLQDDKSIFNSWIQWRISHAKDLLARTWKMEGFQALLVEWELAQYLGKRWDSTKQLDSWVA